MKKLFLLVSVSSILFGQNSVLKQFSNQFADIAEKANPAVVTILTEKNIDLTESHRNLPQDSDLFRFFYNMPRQREYKSTALGSGVIVDSRKGYVITNNHVVEDMDEITVRLLNKSEYDATIIGRDPKSDLAVLQIKAKGLDALKFGDSEDIRVGEWVIAVGSPFSANLSHTVTAGIVSAKGRGNIVQGDVYEDFIQTDAALNPGNSGGALLNSSGDLVGINTAIYTNSFDRSNKGVGFAIPSDTVKKMVPILIRDGELRHPWIGISGIDIDYELAEIRGLDSTKGFLIVSVIEGSPAEFAGLMGSETREIIDGRDIPMDGDIIVKIDGELVRKIADILVHLQMEKLVGDEMVLTILRDGEMMEKTIFLGERPSN